jgi:PHD/YefM family antitoxin component YafN of YafNO toxin-antitoxin module
VTMTSDIDDVDVTGFEAEAAQITSASTFEQVQAANERLTAMKAGATLRASKEQYQEGRRFRVVKPYGRLEGLMFFGNTPGGWSRNLEVGDVLQCTGWKPAYDAEHIEIATFAVPGLPGNLQWVAFHPVASLFMPWPMPGYLELINDGEA